ncbi:hypothetical protein ACQEVB_06255 [Pseudonocardia sp. CA-107938]|uniref:hypothetical protein n=1 Tax=Pseudonocardia sp. CA-107938 TaxID=3240021 RepID=UPI003D8C1822
MEGPTYESTHQLLLGLAGHVDDDLLGWVRELAAVGEEARAVSLVTADVVAERIALPAPVRTALADAARAARAGIDPIELAPAAEPTVEHRFAAAPAGAGDVAAAVRALPARQLQGTSVHLTWRLTPAGTAPGPLPHPVVIVEIDPVRHSGEMLSYLVASGLARGGVHASVEVIAAGQAPPPYQRAALAAAVPVAVGGAPVPEPITENVPTVPAPETTAVTEPVRIVRPVDNEPTVTEPVPEAEPVAEAVEQPADEEPVEPEPVLDPSEPHPFADIPPARPRRRPAADAPALSALSDPLSGPLSEPLMAPLLDPTIHEHDPLGVDHLVGPSRHPLAPVPDEPDEPAEEPAAEEPAPEPEPSPEDSWAAEWESGAWAMPLDELESSPAEPAATTDDEPDDGDVDDDVEREPAPRHGLDLHEEPPAPEPPRQLRAPRPTPMQPNRRGERPDPPAPRGPESRPATRPEPARLSDADRELLARLQAELVQGRKPRRPGASATGRPGSNGRGPNRRTENPPDAS